MTKYRCKNSKLHNKTPKWKNKRISKKFISRGYAIAKKKYSDRTIFGNIYKIDDDLVSLDGYSKPNRRVVVVNNNTKRVQFMKIFGLYDSQGNKRKSLIGISKYPCFDKPSGIGKRVYKKTRFGNYISERDLKRTNSRFNRDDLRKIFRIK